MVGFVYDCASLLVDAGECLSYVCYDVEVCLLITSGLGFVVVNMFYLTTVIGLFIVDSFHNLCILVVMEMYLIIN